MARFIDAEKMPSGELWDQLTDKEKLNVLHYLLSSHTSDVIKNIFEDIEELNCSIVNGQMFFFTKQFNQLKKKYGVEG